MNSFKLEINVGDTVEVGRFRKDIQIDENGQPVIITNKGPKKLFSCRLSKLTPSAKTPRQILKEKR